MELLIVDDHPLFREALASTIGMSYPKAVLHEADDIAAACAVLAAHHDIELTLLDLSMQDVSGFDGLVTIRASLPRVPILVVSGHEVRASCARRCATGPPASCRKQSTRPR